MDNLFSKEQLEELNKISKLPEEEQKKLLPNFLKKLSPEQLENLKEVQQPNQCPFCLIVENKIKAKKIYEDKELIAALEINPATPGHTIIFPKQHISVLSQIKDVSNLFNAVNKVSSLLFDSLGAKGTNILISNGQAAGQFIPHLIINIIPRFEKDNVNLDLKRSKLEEKALDDILNKIKNSKQFEDFIKSFEPKHEKKPEVIKSNKFERIP